MGDIVNFIRIYIAEEEVAILRERDAKKKSKCKRSKAQQDSIHEPAFQDAFARFLGK